MYNYRHKHAIAAQGIAHKSRNPLKMLCILFAFLKSGEKITGNRCKNGTRNADTYAPFVNNTRIAADYLQQNVVFYFTMVILYASPYISRLYKLKMSFY